MGTGVWNKQIGGWEPDDEPETSEYEVSILISASIEAQDEEEAKEIFWDEMKHYASMSDIEIYE
jgi:hypothetical protein